MTLWEYGLGAAVLLVLYLLITHHVERVRFGRLVEWLNLDKVGVARRIQNNDADGLVREMCATFQERFALLTYRLERLVPRFPSEYMGTVEKNRLLYLMHEARNMLVDADPFETPYLEPPSIWEFPPDLRPLVRTYVREAREYGRHQRFFVSWVNRNGVFLDEPEGTA